MDGSPYNAPVNAPSKISRYRPRIFKPTVAKSIVSTTTKILASKQRVYVFPDSKAPALRRCRAPTQTGTFQNVQERARDLRGITIPGGQDLFSGSYASFRQHLKQWSQMTLVFSPATQRPVEQGLTYL